MSQLVVEKQVEEAELNNEKVKSVIELLARELPSFHGELNAGTRSWALATQTLEWIAANLPKDAATLETGCGYSTVTFAAASGEHTVISPFVGEHDLIQKWCEGNNVSTSHVRFCAQSSVDLLPRMDPTPLDMVLVDGAHEFPVPAIDWYYTADRLRKGGIMIIDDTQIPSGYIVMDFLQMERGRWEQVHTIGRTCFFKKLTSEPVARGIGFLDQPWCQMDLSMKGRIKRKLRRMMGIGD